VLKLKANVVNVQRFAELPVTSDATDATDANVSNSIRNINQEYDLLG
jgi:hypothetical protein